MIDSLSVEYLVEIEKNRQEHLKQFAIVVNGTVDLTKKVHNINDDIEELKRKNYQLVYLGVSYVLIMQLLLVGVLRLIW
jgi:uncharacterized protein YnzC (UPF0291/DUF896 family)